MGLFEKLRNELIDIIEFLDNGNNTIIHRFERYQNEIKNNAKLIVREGQIAVFINEGTLADVFNPGTYTLNTQNLPILSTLKGWKYGFDSPFKAEVYFVSTCNFTDQKWGTKNAIVLNDSRFGMLEIRAFGTYTFKIADAGKFIKGVSGTDGRFTKDEITEQLKSIILTRFTDAIGESNLAVENFAANLNELSAAIFNYMKEDFDAYGLEISKFLIENVSMPDDIKKEIFELSRLNKIDLNKFTQFKAAKAIETAADNPSGIAGAGVGMGAGYAIGSQMMQNLNNSSAQLNPTQASAVPPPLPNDLGYFVAIHGQQMGPYAENQLLDLIKNGQMTSESLVWIQGMGNWQQASEVSDLQKLLGQLPPPLPVV